MKKNIKYTLFIAILLTISVFSVKAQNVSINNTGALPNTHSMLDVDVSTNNMGILIPRLSSAQRIAIAGLGVVDEGLTVYDETTNSYWLWDGTKWVEFGMFGDDWALLGNAGTSPATNFLGTTDAQDLVIRTNNVEKMRVESGGDVGIGINNPPYKLSVIDVLDNGTDESATITITTASYAYADDDVIQETIYGVYGFADHSTNGRANFDDGYGVVGSSELGFESSIGVYGTPSDILLNFTNLHAAMVGVYDADRYGIVAQRNMIYLGQYLSDYNGSSFASYLRMENNYNSTTIAKYGMYITNTGTYGLKYGVRVVNDGVAEEKYGVVATLDGAVVNDAINGVAYYGYNVNSQGWGMLLGSEGVGVSYLAGGGGIFSKSRDFSVIGRSTTSTSTGIVGIGQAYTFIHTLVGGSGISGAGTITGVYGYADNAVGSEGGVFAGNGQSPSTLGSGSGVAATGTDIGVFGNAVNSGDGTWGGYFTHGGTAFAYVGGNRLGTNYKIYGSGSVSTEVKDENENPVIMYCSEAPEILFQDYGSGQLVNGKAYIKMDPIFTKNIYVDDNHPIRVFIQLEGDCNGVYVTNKSANGFDVVELQAGKSNVNFSWTVTANRADEVDDAGNLTSKHVGVRFPEGLGKMETETLETINTEIIDDDPDKFKNEEEKIDIEVEEVNIEKIK